MIFLEPSAELARLDLPRAQILILELAERVIAYFLQKGFDPRRRFSRLLQWQTYFAWAEAVAQGIVARFKEHDVFFLGFARGARRAAENPCGFHANPKNSFEGRILAKKRVIHNRI